jgi:predicted nuclease of predicted toxin-antitoxin system
VKPRFLADADLNHAIVRGLKRREPAVDFRSAREPMLLNGMQDADVLAVAAREKRMLVSHDFRTMPHHFREFVAHYTSPGVFLISQALPVGRAVEALLLIWAASDDTEWENQLPTCRSNPALNRVASRRAVER